MNNTSANVQTSSQRSMSHPVAGLALSGASRLESLDDLQFVSMQPPRMDEHRLHVAKENRLAANPKHNPNSVYRIAMENRSAANPKHDPHQVMQQKG
jgi:hypothetical protein